MFSGMAGAGDRSSLGLLSERTGFRPHYPSGPAPLIFFSTDESPEIFKWKKNRGRKDLKLLHLIPECILPNICTNIHDKHSQRGWQRVVASCTDNYVRKPDEDFLELILCFLTIVLATEVQCMKIHHVPCE